MSASAHSMISSKGHKEAKRLYWESLKLGQLENSSKEEQNNKPIVEDAAWQSQHYSAHTCKRMFEYIQTHGPSTPMSLAAVWRIIHCKKCGFTYHTQIAAMPELSEYYVRFGGDVKIIHTKRPKSLIRDLPGIKAAVSKGVKADPKMKPGGVKCAADNTYLFEKLGDVAILAGMIDPEYVSESVDDFLVQRLCHFKAYDSVPGRIAYDITDSGSNIMVSHYGVFDRIILAALFKDPTFDQTRQIHSLIFAAIPWDIIAKCYLIHPDPDMSETDIITKSYDVFGDANKYKEHVAKRVQSFVEEVKKQVPDKAVTCMGNYTEYLPGDLYAVPDSVEYNIIIAHYSFLIECGLIDANFCRSHYDAKMLKVRDNLLGKGWENRPTMTAVEIRSMLIERFKQKRLDAMSLWTFSQFANCDFDEPGVGAHPTASIFKN